MWVLLEKLGVCNNLVFIMISNLWIHCSILAEPVGFVKLVSILFMCVPVYECMHVWYTRVHAIACMWRSEDSLKKLLLSFTVQAQHARLGEWPANSSADPSHQATSPPFPFLLLLLSLPSPPFPCFFLKNGNIIISVHPLVCPTAPCLSDVLPER